MWAFTAGLLGPLAAVGPFLADRRTVPWSLLVLGTGSVVLMGLAFSCARTRWRLAGLVVVGLLAGAEWYFLFSRSILSTYAGPVVEGKPFPTFQAKAADGRPFTPDDLQDGQGTLMVFFRGRW